MLYKKYTMVLVQSKLMCWVYLRLNKVLSSYKYVVWSIKEQQERNIIIIITIIIIIIIIIIINITIS